MTDATSPERLDRKLGPTSPEEVANSLEGLPEAIENIRDAVQTSIEGAQSVGMQVPEHTFAVALGWSHVA